MSPADSIKGQLLGTQTLATLVRFLELVAGGAAATKGDFGSYVLLSGSREPARLHVQANLAEAVFSIELVSGLELEGDFQAVVHAESLLRALRSLARRLPLRIEREGNVLKLSPAEASGSAYSLACVSLTDYPERPALRPQARGLKRWDEDQVEALLERLRALKGFSDREDGLMVFEWEAGEGRLIVQGEYRAAFAVWPSPTDAELTFRFSLSRPNAERLGRFLSSCGKVTLTPTGAGLLLVQGPLGIATACLALQQLEASDTVADYLNFATCDSSLRLWAQPFGEALEAVEAVLAPGDRDCALRLKDGLLELRCESAQKGEAHCSLEAKAEGKPWPILHVELRLLSQALANLTAPQVNLSYFGSRGALRIDDGATWHVMSVREDM